MPSGSRASSPTEGPSRAEGPARDSDHQVPGVVAPTTRVNVALPFSHFQVEEPTRELRELAQVVAKLAAALEESAPGPQARLARKQADALAARLR